MATVSHSTRFIFEYLSPTGRSSPRRRTFWRVAVIFIAEFGDLTQIVTATLAARYQQPLAVGIAALAALLAVAALAIGGGRVLMRVLPVRWLTRACAAAMLILAALGLVSALPTGT
jgi:putative Ca2+/H+ antiporter (TMEM165/GDT1 family)